MQNAVRGDDAAFICFMKYVNRVGIVAWIGDHVSLQPRSSSSAAL